MSFTFQSGYIQIKSSSVNRSSACAFTFQSGYIQIVILLVLSVIRVSLYIPIWLYSNQNSKFSFNTVKVFTFQSGYIQMSDFEKIKNYLLKLYIPIWLYSNVALLKPYRLPLSSLHSNLVIFKSTCELWHSLGLAFFTFQSGYIQIMLSEEYINTDCALHSNLVIFK